ncbi:DNA translocase FtsK [Staphylococcus aureus]|nr:DNA translocase FtsK [Staphylococcus aureus]
MINDYGQLQAINKDLSGLEDEETKENQTELEAVIDHIESITTRLEIEEVKRPWLPPLPENVYQEDLVETDFRKLWSDDAKEVELTLGLKDVPEEQYQGPMVLQLKKAGHIALIGSPGYGRTTFLHNIIFDVARHHRPDQAHMYLFDFGTNGLMPVTDIPHVADYFTVDQEDKIAKAIRKIHDIISERKRLLSQERVVNIEQYNKETGNSIPNIFLIIDNYDTVKESPFMEEYEEMMSKVTREGLALGVYIILSGSRSSAIKSAIFTNIKTRVALYLFENNELTNIIGSYKKGVKDVKGRAAINDDNFTQFQIAQPFELAEGQTYNERIKNEVAQMKEFYVGDYPKHIPMMPDKVLMDDIQETYDLEKIIHEEHKLPLGLDFEDVELVGFDLSQTNIFTSVKPVDIDNGLTLLEKQLNIISNEYEIATLDTKGILKNTGYEDYLYCGDKKEIISFKNELVSFIKNVEPRKKWIVVISDFKEFINIASPNNDEIKTIFLDGPKNNVFPIIYGLYQETIGGFSSQIKLLKEIVSSAFVGISISEQELIKVRYKVNEKNLKNNEMYYIYNYEYKKIKLFE